MSTFIDSLPFHILHLACFAWCSLQESYQPQVPSFKGTGFHSSSLEMTILPTPINMICDRNFLQQQTDVEFDLLKQTTIYISHESSMPILILHHVKLCSVVSAMPVVLNHCLMVVAQLHLFKIISFIFGNYSHISLCSFLIPNALI